MNFSEQRVCLLNWWKRMFNKDEERFFSYIPPLGPTTIFFWAPLFKWGLVIAGLGDLKRPAHSVSLRQTASLMVTGAIWSRCNITTCLQFYLLRIIWWRNVHTICLNLYISRYSLVIIPKNYNLFSVNVFICCTSGYNFTRGLIDRMKGRANKKEDEEE